MKTHIVRLALTVGVTASLIGCTTPRAVIDLYQQQCEAYGFKRNTDAMAQCIQKLDKPQ
jgi:hypothetical protein